MDNKTKGIVATVLQSTMWMSRFVPVHLRCGNRVRWRTFTLGSESGNIPPTTGYVLLCLSIIMVLIPLVVGFFMLRKKPRKIHR